MIIDYNGSVQLWEHKYYEGEKNGDRIEKKIKKISHIELSDGKLAFNKNKSLTVVRISKAYIYKGKEKTKQYRRLVRIETTGNGKPPKNLTGLLKTEDFEKKV